ncbi:energy transducer TonB [Dokdonella sp.]|uniref:energy transducer TonB n=1 Tax=Dokdonella sp. TaxID=2291710 RepID=UPI002F4266D8
MATPAAAHLPRPDWQRVTALGTSFLMHAIAAMAVAVPLTMQVERIEPRRVEATLIEEPSPLPPPPPEQEPRPRAPVQHAPSRPQSIAPPAPARSVIEVPATPTPVDIAPARPSSPENGMPGGAAGGETRRLAYDGALKLRYPATALRARRQGDVLLDVLVDASGNVQRVEIARSSGHADLDTAARDAVLRAHFKPVLRDGEPVAGWGVVPIEFRLDRA